MQKILPIGILLAYASCAAAQAKGASSGAAAQTARSVSQVERRVIELHNVPPQMAAWSLDPGHNPKPLVYEIAWNAIRSWLLGSEMPSALPALALPAGVEIVTAQAGRSELVAYGTAAGLNELETLVRKMDVPLTQVDIGAHFVEIADEEVAKLNLSFQFVPPPRGPAGDVAPQMALWNRGNIDLIIKDWVAAGKAKVLDSRRSVTINNLPFAQHSTFSNSIDPAIFPGSEKQFKALPSFCLASGIIAWPRAVTQETVSLDFYGGRSLLLKAVARVEVALPAHPPRHDGSRFLAPDGFLTAQITLGDGQVAVLKGLTSAPTSVKFLRSEPSLKPAENRQTLIFVTARIVRRMQVAKVGS